ncbi:MAG: hypothetical protein ACYS3N_10010, partial [Planctomycetota bacterium]
LTTLNLQKITSKLRQEGIEQAMQWKVLIDTNGIESRAELARYPVISRARVTQVLRRLPLH